MKLRLLFSLLLLACFAAPAFSQATSIGIIGPASPLANWDEDVDLVQDADSAHYWTLTANLNAGDIKFRQDNDWAVNWGATDFPVGTGLQGGSNIPVPAAGEYSIFFDSKSGLYVFDIKSDIGIIGSATPLGWGRDINMVPDPADSNAYSLVLNLAQGDVKFRQNDDWAVNWGNTGFPTDTAVQNGPNITIPIAAKYRVTFNKATGIYSFSEVADYTTIGIIGSATAGGWADDTDLIRDPNKPEIWKAALTLTDGEAKFRANDGWSFNWGATAFPIGIGEANGPNIPVVAGTYLVTFNTLTFEYKFLPIVNYPTVGIIGSATPGGWASDVDMTQDASDISIWTKRMIFTDGEAKFRANDDWAINWGGGDFPAGVASQDGPNIPVTAGEYIVTFNSTTGEYNFKLLIIYSTVGIVGPATPLASWDVDVDMTKDAVDETFWYIPSIELIDGEAKFRAEDAWAVNWGATDWPKGTGKQDGPNIPITAGTYRVTLASGSGEYNFTSPSSTINLLDENVLRLTPNPATDVVKIVTTAEDLNGTAQVIIFNSLGQRVRTQTIDIQGTATLNVAGLAPGNYLVHLANGKVMVGKTLVVAGK